MTTIAILHYASPPTVGGVESTIDHHARGLAALGYQVRVISGKGEKFTENVEVVTHELFGSRHPDILAAQQQLSQGIIPENWAVLVEQVTAALRECLEGCKVCIAHNVPTLHKNLALTAALARLNEAGQTHVIAWCHDLAWTNEQYLPEMHAGNPWNLLKQVWPGARYVTVSESRQPELAQLLGVAPEQIVVVPPGIDPARFMRWTSMTQELDKQLNLLEADGLLLLPARLTRRKNIEMAVQVLGEIRRLSNADFRLIVTGPPGPHNPGNVSYLDELRTLAATLGVSNTAHFLYECGSEDAPLIPDDDTIANLYQLADALLFPSLQEGFGIPVLEAGLVGLPVFCADIPPFRLTGQADVFYFDPVTSSPSEIATAIWQHLQASPTARLRVRVRQEYRWNAIIAHKIVPLLEEI